MEISVLIVEDDPDWLKILDESLTKEGMLTITYATPEEAMYEIRNDLQYHAAIVDLAHPLSHYSGLDVFYLSKGKNPLVPVVTISTAREQYPIGDATFCKSDGSGHVGELVNIVRRLTKVKEVKR